MSKTRKGRNRMKRTRHFVIQGLLGIALGGLLVAAPRSHAWPGAPLTTDQMLSTVGGQGVGWECVAPDNCIAECDPQTRTTWDSNPYHTCEQTFAGECYNNVGEDCEVKTWLDQDCTIPNSFGYHMRPACSQL
jgi:hypothetical protein